MEVLPKDSSGPLTFGQLPPEIQSLCNSLVDGLEAALADNLFGAYFYGAMVFPETRYIQDIDFHIVVKNSLTVEEKEKIQSLHKELARRYPIFGNELDGYYILLSDAQKVATPWHQVFPDIPDEAWPLHIAHMRAGYCMVLYGPEPGSFLPEPLWEDLVNGLRYVFKHALDYLDIAPDYCILVFCRILYSYTTRNVVVSKRGAAEWTLEHYSSWKRLIEAALRVFEKNQRKDDRRFLERNIDRFYQFVKERINGKS